MLIVSTATSCSVEPASPKYFEPRGVVYVSPEFSTEQSEIVIQAMSTWQAATNGEVAFDVRIGQGHPLIRPAVERDRINGEFILSDEPEIALDTTKAFDPRSLRNLTLHELGHALGLEHIERSESVMFPFATTVQELDAWTLAAWRARSQSFR
jgi:hypothetical protein